MKAHLGLGGSSDAPLPPRCVVGVVVLYLYALYYIPLRSFEVEVKVDEVRNVTAVSQSSLSVTTVCSMHVHVHAQRLAIVTEIL